MSFEHKLIQINELQQKINSYGKLPDAVLKKINYKFRLEWNYTSNSMEGNTLTKEETRSVMIGNITVEGKPIKDILEMKGHDEIINTILKIGKGELNLSEKRIKEIHIGIMHEEDPEKKKSIGQWKTVQNYLYNYKNERFDFVAPADVPDRMHQLMNWLNVEKDKIQRKANDAVHPVELALKFNLEYVSIHPFYDGNGRTSRILTNLILITYGYPPLYIKENERGGYMQYLGDIQGYGGAPDVFFDYMSGLIIRSQQLVLDAMFGKNIEEPDDIDKEITMWMKGLTSESIAGVQRSDAEVCNLWEHSISPLLHVYIEKHKLLQPLFVSMEVNSIVNNSFGNGIEYIEDQLQQYYSSQKVPMNVDGELKRQPPNLYEIKLNLSLRGYKKNGMDMFDWHATISFYFEQLKWRITFSNSKKIEKLYDQTLSDAEIFSIVREAIKDAQTEIDRMVNKQY